MILILVSLGVLWWLSNVVYSLYFGPLRHIPSPLIFQWFPVYFEVLVGLGQSPQKLSSYHRKYGAVFRTGWRRVMVVSGEGAKQMYSSDQFLKSRLYSGFGYFGANLLSERDPPRHRARKRVIGTAFTVAKVNSMEATVTKVGLEPLLGNLSKGGPINICHQLHCLAWDVMGELALGGTFHLLQNGHHPAMDWLSSVTNAAQLAYLFPFLKYFPSSASRSLHAFTDELLSRPNENAPIRDAISKLPSQDILAECHLMLFGGTDTSSNAITFLLHHLLLHPHFLQLILDEIDSLPSGHIEYKQCRDLPYLNAAIKETLRLLPPVAGTPLRITPKDGWRIHGHYIPGNTEVGVPTYALHRSPELWSKPDTFQPDRWLSNPTPEAYMPFLIGPNACIGKSLAMMEISLISANLLRQFHLQAIHPLELTCDPTLRPKLHQYWVNVLPRLQNQN